MKKCIVEGCGKIDSKGGFGYCGKHYKRFKKHGDPLYEYKHEIIICSIDRCNERQHAHKLCGKHLYYYQKENNLRKDHIHKCRYCNENFTTKFLKSKFCSRKCFYENEKQSRKGKNNPAYRHGVYSGDWDRNEFYYKEKLFIRNRNDIKEEMIRDYGYEFCQHCKTTNTLRFENHHLIFRSEKPKHEYLHDKRNIIHLCIKCHNEAHKHKHEFRKQYIEQRNLTELFGNDILPLTL